MDTTDFTCNFMILGKSGVGKSSLINYLFNSDIAETGAGRPVTGQGFFEYVEYIGEGNQKVRVFDSWGIEAGKSQEWKNLLAEHLDRHNIDKELHEWIHAVVYCVQTGGHRVEDIDVQIIRQFISDGYYVVVAFTKQDQGSEKNISDLKKTVLKEVGKGLSRNVAQHSTRIVATCAEEKETRVGKVYQSGKEELTGAILTGWKTCILKRLPDRCVLLLHNYIDEAGARIKAKFKIDSFSGWEENNNWIFVDIKEQIELFKEELERTILEILRQQIEACNIVGASLSSTLETGISVEVDAPFVQKDTGKILSRIVQGVLSVGINTIYKYFSGKKRAYNHAQNLIDNTLSKMKNEISENRDKIAKELSRAINW